jgi:hypothetical protein
LTINAPAETIYNVTGLEASWTGSDTGSGMAGYQYSLDGLYWSDTEQFSDVVLTGLSDGNHTFLVKATDNAGNSLVRAVSFTVDANAPQLFITSPVEGRYFNHSAGNDVTVTWSSSDGITGVAYYLVRVNGGGWNERTSASLSLNGLADGVYRIDVRSCDVAGNTAQTSVNFTVDGTAPTLTISSPRSSTYNVDVIEAAWSGSDVTSGCTFSYRLDSGLWSGAAPAMGTNLSSLAQGEHTLQVRAVDGAGNSVTGSVTFSVDSVNPTISSYSPEGVNVSIGCNLTVTFSEAMNRTSLVLSIEGLAGTTTWSNDTVTLDPTDAMAHLTKYTVTVSGTDLAGNPVSKSWSFTTIGYQGELKGVMRDGNGVPMANAHLRLSNGMTTTTDANGNFAFEGLAPGDYSITISRAGYADSTLNATVGMDQSKDMGSIDVSMSPVAQTNWMPFIVAGLLSGLVGAFLIIVMIRKRRNKER